MLSPTTRNMGASLSPQPDVSGELNTEALTCKHRSIDLYC